MPTYLYGLILSRNADRVPSNVTGIDRTAVRVARCHMLAGLVGTMEKAPSRENVEAIGLHDRATLTVVRGTITVAASRFGQMFSNDDAFCAELATSPNTEALITTLERYDGFGEMRVSMRDMIEPSPSVRASNAASEASEAPEATEAPGRAYLESLREQLKPRPAFDARALLGDLVFDERVERRKNALTIAHLVRFGDEARYRAVLQTHPGLKGAAITGPHALYAFAQPD